MGSAVPPAKPMPIPSSIVIEPGPYAMYVLMPKYKDKPSITNELEAARLVLVQGGERTEDMSIDQKTGDLLIWVHKSFKDTEEKLLNFYAVDYLGNDLNVLTHTLNKNLELHFLQAEAMQKQSNPP